MSLRTRLVLAFVTLTTAAAVAVGAWSYAATVERLYAEIDRSLADIAAIVAGPGPDARPRGIRSESRTTSVRRPRTCSSTQVIDGTGSPVSSEPGLAIPIDDSDRALAAGADRTASDARDIALSDARFRLLTVAAGPGPRRGPGGAQPG